MLPVSHEDSQPMTRSQSEILLTLVLLDKAEPEKAQELITDELKEQFPYKAYAKRMEVLKLPLKLSPTALIFLISLCKVTGHIPVFMIDCLELQELLGVDHLTLDDVAAQLYPWGFYNEEAFGRRVDEIKQGKGKYDFIY